MGITDVLALLGGLALFLYGMQMMSTGLEAAAGNRMKSILEKLTSNRIKGVLVGAAITAVIQSSSATTVMVVGFVNSGLMTLKQAVWVIMGANIGTTITGQLIALDIGAIAPLFAIAGVGAIMFIKSEKVHHISSIFAGLGILFMGMDMMGAAMSPLKESEAFISLMTKFDNPLLGILVGALYGSDPVIFCIGRYFAGACVYRYDPALKRGVRFVRTKHRNMYHGSFGIDRNEGKCKAYDGYPSVI